jgi:hypothetical protein
VSKVGVPNQQVSKLAFELKAKADLSGAKFDGTFRNDGTNLFEIRNDFPVSAILNLTKRRNKFTEKASSTTGKLTCLTESRALSRTGVMESSSHMTVSTSISGLMSSRRETLELRVSGKSLTISLLEIRENLTYLRGDPTTMSRVSSGAPRTISKSGLSTSTTPKTEASTWESSP